MAGLLGDLRGSWRKMKARPLASGVMVLCVALGIAATTTVYGVLRGALLTPFIFPDQHELKVIWVSLPSLESKTEVVSGPEYLSLEQQDEIFADMGAGIGFAYTLESEDGNPEHLRGMGVLPSLFPTLGVEPLVGRWLLEEDAVEGAPLVVVVSYDLWQRRFGGDPSLVGRSVDLSGEIHTVVGVMPPRFRFGRSDFWNAYPRHLLPRAPRSQRFLWTVARLRDGVGARQAAAGLEVLARQLEEEHLGEAPEYAGWKLTAEPIGEVFAGEIKTGLRLAMGAAAFVLLIVCANVANLLLVQALAREKEIATRAAFGAGRGRIARQLLTEAALPVVVGGALGLLATFWAVRLVASAIPQEYLAADAWFGIDAATLAIALGLTLAAALLVGLAPAFRTSRPDLQESLKQGGRGAGNDRRGRLLLGFVVALEVAAALTLAAGFGLMFDGFARLEERDPGFDADGVLTFHLDIPRERYNERQTIAEFYDRFERRLAALPGVEAAGAVRILPLEDYISPVMVFALGGEDQAEASASDARETVFLTATPGYFRAMKIPLLRGRLFTGEDGAGGAPVALVNQAFAERFLAGRDPLGEQIRMGRPRLGDSWRSIVGVVADVKQTRLTEEVQPAVYIPNLQMPRFGFNWMRMAVRSSLDPAGLAATVRREVEAVDPGVPVFNVRPFAEEVADSLGGWRLCVALLTALAGVAVLLAALGLYGVISYSVRQRVQELGLRMALGARRRDVLAMVVGQGMKLVGAGVVLGAVGIWFLTRYLSTLALEVRLAEPATYAAVTSLLLAVSLAACAVPAWQAARTDPVDSLREE